MALKLLKEYVLGDMVVRYRTDETGKQVGLMLLPKEPESCEYTKEEALDSLVQYKLAGDIYDEAYAMGNSMRNSESVRRLELKCHQAEEADGGLVIKTILKDERGYEVTHILKWIQEKPYLRIFCTFENLSPTEVDLEMFESFSLGGLTPYSPRDSHETMAVHRIRSTWSCEGKWETRPVEDFQLEPAWDPHAVRCEKFGQVGSMPVNKFFPFVAVEDQTNHVFWGAQIAHYASWQIELYRKDEGLCVSGGLADRDFGHWMKTIRPGESFQTPEAIVSVARTGSFDVFTNRLVEAAVEHSERLPEIEQDLPIVFNEYCTTWGNPSHANISEIVDCIKDKGFTYFVIDCGWYKQKGIPWDIAMGDYDESPELFPEGIKKTAQKIRAGGMIPGIWFEIETVGEAAAAYQMEDHLLHKDGKVLTSYFRRFWDMKDPWVQEYLAGRVIEMLIQYGFGYMKIDYNETIGIGCDGAESLGEGLRQNMAASADFFERIKKEVPGIVLENCASGGHRLEPGLMGQMSMASFSDAHECVEIPIIAANLHRVIHPRQSQIWAVIRETDSRKRIVYSIASTFLGRMCISGDITRLSKEQWEIISRGMAFYREISDIIKWGQSFRYGTEIRSVRHPRGWQALLRVGCNEEAVAVFHVFGDEIPETIELELPENAPKKVVSEFSDSSGKIKIVDNKLYYTPCSKWVAAAVKLVNNV
ncbi:MAG: glycoside hydrolase family 36 protein [Lachnospiraceae bacterium]